MKLTFIIGSLNLDGATSWLFNLVKYLDRDKFSINVIVFTKVEPNDRTKTLLEQNLCEITILDSPSHKLNPLYHFKLCKLLSGKGKELIVNCNPQLSGIVRIFSKILRKPNVFVFHNRISSFKVVIRWQEKITRSLSDYNVACSSSVFRELGDIPFAKKALIYNTEIPNNQITDSRKYKIKYSIPEDAIIYLNIARYHPQKNQEALISAFNKFRIKNPDCYLILTGWGQLESKLRRKIQDLDCSKNIILTGPIHDIWNLYIISDFYIMSSFFEGLSIATVKALSFSLPLIVTPINEFDDLRSSNTIDFEGFDEKAILEGLWKSKRLTNENYNRMKYNSSLLYRQRFDPKIMANSYTDIFLKIANDE